MSKKIKIAIAGLGTVGSGVLELLKKINLIKNLVLKSLLLHQEEKLIY